MKHAGASGLWIPAACFIVAFAALPLIIVWVSPGLDTDGFVCRAEVKTRLAETLGGKLEFLLAEALDGRPPADRFVVTLDHGYTAGIPRGPASPGGSGETQPGDAFWLHGTLMDRETYYGEQYLFFGYPQLYVSQVRSGLFWPSQLRRLKDLYLAPVYAPASLYLIVAFPFMEEFSAGTWGLIAGRLALVTLAVAAAVVHRVRRRRWRPGIVWVVGCYALAAVGLTAPGL